MKFALRGLTVLAATAAMTVTSLSAAAFAAPAGSGPAQARSIATPGKAVSSSAAHATTARQLAHPKTTRLCSAAPKRGHKACFSLRQTSPVEPKAFEKHSISPAATPSGYGPSDLRSAYKLPTTGGAGATVAIVDAYNDPNAESDLGVYRTQYGLPACTTANGCFSKVNQNGAASPLPTNDSGWAGEIALDLDMVSATCPACHILLVEANAATDADLYAAEDRAVTMGAKFVSNSWGGDEYASQTTDDAHFNHPGVAITVSSGDNGNGAQYPASSRYVTAVGGTHLTTASNTRGWTESAWSGAGSGCSAYDAKPTWQTVTTNCSRRAEADVSAVADPATGVAVYITYGASGWNVYGGTSAAAPIVAGVYALAGTPAAGTYPASYPYSHASNLFDVTSGNNGSCGAPLCTAGTGWDGPTGLGTPNGPSAFAGGGGSTSVTLANPGTQTGRVGTAVSLQLSASGGTTPYTFSATGLPAGLSINNSTGLISGTPTTAASYTVNATVKSPNGTTATVTFTFTISAASSCTSTQVLGNTGFETGSAAPWTASAGVIDNSSSEPAHTGSWKAWMDGYGTTHTDTLTQTASVPAACSGATLSFYLHIDTAETTTTTQYDKLTVKIGATTLATFSNLNHNTGYAVQTYNVGPFTGQSLAFTATEDSSLQTSFVVDDVTLTSH